VHEESFRKYLLGQSAFPRSARIALFVDDDPDPTIMLSGPSSAREEGRHICTFHIPGILYKMFLGEFGDSLIGELYDQVGSDSLLVLRPFRKTREFRETVSLVGSSPAVGNLLDDDRRHDLGRKSPGRSAPAARTRK
jgi:hypothetical protein